MTQKTISLPEDVYNKLKARKKKKESFPELIVRLLKEDVKEDERSIESFFGAFDEESDEWEDIEKRLYNNRMVSSNRKQILMEKER